MDGRNTEYRYCTKPCSLAAMVTDIQSVTMKKWISRILVSILMLIVLVILVGLWFLHEAFGPKKRTVTIIVDKSKTLICDETYNADLAAVFYNVNFKLQDNKHGNFSLGSAVFTDNHWDREIQLNSIGKWYLLPVKSGSYSKLLFTNSGNHKSMDTTFSPQTLRYDSLWKLTSDGIPAWVYSGSSQLDSIKQNKLFVTFNYRFGLNDSFKFLSQTIEYEFDTVNGSITTKKIFEAKEK